MKIIMCRKCWSNPCACEDNILRKEVGKEKKMSMNFTTVLLD